MSIIMITDQMYTTLIYNAFPTYKGLLKYRCGILEILHNLQHVPSTWPTDLPVYNFCDQTFSPSCRDVST